MLLFHQAWVPPQQTQEMVMRYMEYVKASPQDESIATVLSTGVQSLESGFRIITIKKVVPGQMEKAVAATARYDMEIASKVEGYRFSIEPILDMTEALEVMGIHPG